MKNNRPVVITLDKQETKKYIFLLNKTHKLFVIITETITIIKGIKILFLMKLSIEKAVYLKIKINLNIRAIIFVNIFMYKIHKSD